MEWIKFSDKPPEKMVRILGHRYNEELTIARYIGPLNKSSNEELYNDGFALWYDFIKKETYPMRICHYIEIPEPPKKKWDYE